MSSCVCVCENILHNGINMYLFVVVDSIHANVSARVCVNGSVLALFVIVVVDDVFCPVTHTQSPIRQAEERESEKKRRNYE